METSNSGTAGSETPTPQHRDTLVSLNNLLSVSPSHHTLVSNLRSFIPSTKEKKKGSKTKVADLQKRLTEAEAESSKWKTKFEGTKVTSSLYCWLTGAGGNPTVHNEFQSVEEGA